MKRAPPPSARPAEALPPCVSATWRTIASPSPEPGRPRARGRAVEAVEEPLAVLVGDPRPAIAHRHGAVCDGDLDRLARAPADRVLEQIDDRTVEARRRPRTSVGSRLRTKSPPGFSGERVPRSGDELSSRTSSSSSARSPSRASSTRSPTSAVSSSSCCDDVLDHACTLPWRRRLRAARGARCSYGCSSGESATRETRRRRGSAARWAGARARPASC